MAKLYYGDGSCTVEGSDIVGVEITYRGSIDILDKTPDGYFLINRNNKIIIAPLPIHNNNLNDLFDYSGNLRILHAIVVDSTPAIVPVIVKRVMDYAELITSTAETMTTKSEDLKSGYVDGKRLPIRPIKQKIISDLDTKTQGALLYLSDGTQYEGMYHIHLEDSAAMTGTEHTEDSQDLFYKQYLGGRLINKLVPTRTPNHNLPGKNVRLKAVNRRAKKQ